MCATIGPGAGWDPGLCDWVIFTMSPLAKGPATKLLAESAFNLPPLPPPEVLNSLGATRWSHWGLREPTRLDYPVHTQIEQMQRQVLARC